MGIYQYNVYVKETYNATGKAKGDVIRILNSLNINDLYRPSRYRLVRVVQQFLAISKLRNKAENILFIQYPAVIDRFIEKADTKFNLVAIIHDLQSIRGSKTVEDEIKVLNRFSTVISHNSSMTNYLRVNGFKNSIVELELFDYLHDSKLQVKSNSFFKKRVTFAGNLNKSRFITKLDSLKSIDFLLYGLLDDPSKLDNLNNVEYKGSLPSDTIVNELEGEFGLVWDGEEIETCSGILGNYLKFNNPHKISLYLAANKPVIVWKESAVAKFVEKNKVGITISSLQELDPILSSMSKEEYEELEQNVKKVKLKIADGYYTKKAVKNILSQFSNEEVQ
ncbi:hypothetical protein [Latilactobacillus curvatus]|uniref:hypothetical protein n=1 Tax=Latilactobacillus curvatus TaxID=28038 RepID=UPI002D77E8C8|nr:hypothetical protein [Latilactobacillus curvatus]WRS46839.1 hypothetical protein VDS61_04020 [Latilactobacillus curvatus]